jgi:hypothetical protein
MPVDACFSGSTTRCLLSGDRDDRRVAKSSLPVSARQAETGLAALMVDDAEVASIPRKCSTAPVGGCSGGIVQSRDRPSSERWAPFSIVQCIGRSRIHTAEVGGASPLAPTRQVRGMAGRRALTSHGAQIPLHPVGGARQAVKWGTW